MVFDNSAPKEMAAKRPVSDSGSPDHTSPQKKGTHRKRRSQYFEAEVHTSEASIEDDDRPSQRVQQENPVAVRNKL